MRSTGHSCYPFLSKLLYRNYVLSVYLSPHRARRALHSMSLTVISNDACVVQAAHTFREMLSVPPAQEGINVFAVRPQSNEERDDLLKRVHDGMSNELINRKLDFVSLYLTRDDLVAYNFLYMHPGTDLLHKVVLSYFLQADGQATVRFTRAQKERQMNLDKPNILRRQVYCA